MAVFAKEDDIAVSLLNNMKCFNINKYIIYQLDECKYDY